MARLVAAFALAMLAACGAGHDRGPAWPKRSDPEVDGGESLAPRTASVVAAAAAEKDTKVEAKTDDAKPDDTKTDKPIDAKPAATTTTPTDDVIIIDDIVIEIED